MHYVVLASAVCDAYWLEIDWARDEAAAVMNYGGANHAKWPSLSASKN